jgi:histidinol-phosphate aminotransferase
MHSLAPHHGGTDSLPDPAYDFSSNANALGPCPWVLAAVRRADVSRYPDPSYARIRETLAQRHGVSSDRIVVGAGASELVLRLIRRFRGPVHQLAPTFSEYARGARIAGRHLISSRTPEAFLRRQSKKIGLGFICWPNNPTGDVWPLDFVAEASRRAPLIVDMAYAPLCGASSQGEIEAAAADAFRLYSPNKAFGLTGVRAGYVVMPGPNEMLAGLAPSWVIGQDAVSFLEAASEAPARDWLAQGIPQLKRWRSQLARSLRQLGSEVREGPATFLMARVGEAARVAGELRNRDVRVRDCTSFGLPEWIRMSAQPTAAQKVLITALKRILRRGPVT